MKFRTLLSAFLLAAGLVFVAGCGEEPLPSVPPTDVVKQYFDAYKKHDTATMKNLSCDAQNFADDFQNDVFNDSFSKQCAQEYAKDFKFECVSENIDGDEATVTVKVTKKGKTWNIKTKLRIDDGKWKISDNGFEG